MVTGWPIYLDASWSPPLFGWLKINFDGSVHPNNQSGLGCTIRNHNDELIVAKGVSIHSWSVNMTEIRSALCALTAAKDLMSDTLGLILEGDSAFACSTLNRVLSGVYDGDVEAKLARLMKDYPRLSISAISRRANSAADFVANKACVSDFVWERGMPLDHTFAFILSQDFHLL
ncbi:hypothetical protein KSP40_PGU004774 [Platanthera guangdongensis]|uniref:RNase H type-1 domain-containing protein n=1 Tax=Platanthera guangdongensis TaxID=2320717 RepID=A0ABR2M266_9ASPA